MCLLSERAHMICQTHVDPEPRGRLAMAAEAARRALAAEEEDYVTECLTARLRGGDRPGQNGAAATVLAAALGHVTSGERMRAGNRRAY